MKVQDLPWIDPAHAFLALADDPHLAFLDSAATGDPRAETSYLCTDPIAVMALDGTIDPYTTLADWIAAYPVQPAPDWPFPFAGGLVGWLGYDLARAATGVTSRFPSVPGLPGGWFGLYDTVLGFNHRTQRAWILAADRPDQTAATRIATLIARLANPTAPQPLPALAWQPALSRAAYEARITQLRAYIAAGDIYQANFTTSFTAPRPQTFSPAAYHLALRARSPAPFAAYLDCGDGVALTGASPERFLRLTPTGHVETRPIKGTTARHPDPAEDAASASTLAASPKERAENLMIVDLLRNDLSQVCEIGSVAVPELFAVESYAQAHHLVSAITGRLRPQLGAADLLRATCPGGSITGAPKRRAMEIIDELETALRGAYCGAVIWIGFDGAMDSSIIIRSLIATSTTLFAQAGGGITWDSDPAAEYDEMMLKISPLLAP